MDRQELAIGRKFLQVPPKDGASVLGPSTVEFTLELRIKQHERESNQAHQ